MCNGFKPVQHNQDFMFTLFNRKHFFFWSMTNVCIFFYPSSNLQPWLSSVLVCSNTLPLNHHRNVWCFQVNYECCSPVVSISYTGKLLWNPKNKVRKNLLYSAQLKVTPFFLVTQDESWDKCTFWLNRTYATVYLRHLCAFLLLPRNTQTQ